MEMWWLLQLRAGTDLTTAHPDLFEPSELAGNNTGPILVDEQATGPGGADQPAVQSASRPTAASRPSTP